MVGYKLSRLLQHDRIRWPISWKQRVTEIQSFCTKKEPPKPAAPAPTPTPNPPPSNRGKTESKDNSVSVLQLDKLKWGSFIVGSGLCGALLWAVYELGKPELDHRDQIIEDELSKLPFIQQYFQRMWLTLQYYQKMLEEPMPNKLLPDVLRPPYIQPPYTLVLEVKDVLVHPDWTYQTGWRFKKRPGVDYFLQQCARHFEIVVYTAEQGMTVFPILDALDPNCYIRYRLVRGATQFVDGHHIKNINRLNRNLKRVIVVDWDRNATRLHPDNAFAMTRWLGNDDDVQLFDLVAFLQLVAENRVDDVREVLHYYRQFEDPIQQFKENHRKLLEQTQEREVAPPASQSSSWQSFCGCFKR